MEKAKGKVTSISKKDGRYSVAIGFNNWYGGYGECPCAKGDEVEIEYEVAGQWKNITSLKVLTKAPEDKGQTFGRDPDTIVKTDCYRMAVDMCIAGQITLEQVEPTAEDLFTKINK